MLILPKSRNSLEIIMSTMVLHLSCFNFNVHHLECWIRYWTPPEYFPRCITFNTSEVRANLPQSIIIRGQAFHPIIPISSLPTHLTDHKHSAVWVTLWWMRLMFPQSLFDLFIYRIVIVMHFSEFDLRLWHYTSGNKEFVYHRPQIVH